MGKTSRYVTVQCYYLESGNRKGIFSLYFLTPIRHSFGSEETNVDIYDEKGNFNWVPLIKSGLKVPQEYMEWRSKESNNAYNEGRVKPWSELRSKIESKLK